MYTAATGRLLCGKMGSVDSISSDSETSRWKKNREQALYRMRSGRCVSTKTLSKYDLKPDAAPLDPAACLRRWRSDRKSHERRARQEKQRLTETVRGKFLCGRDVDNAAAMRLALLTIRKPKFDPPADPGSGDSGENDGGDRSWTRKRRRSPRRDPYTVFLESLLRDGAESSRFFDDANLCVAKAPPTTTPSPHVTTVCDSSSRVSK